MIRDHTLAIDFGTSNSAAAVVLDGQIRRQGPALLNERTLALIQHRQAPADPFALVVQFRRLAMPAVQLPAQPLELIAHGVDFSFNSFQLFARL